MRLTAFYLNQPLLVQYKWYYLSEHFQHITTSIWWERWGWKEHKLRRLALESAPWCVHGRAIGATLRQELTPSAIWSIPVDLLELLWSYSAHLNAGYGHLIHVRSGGSGYGSSSSCIDRLDRGAVLSSEPWCATTWSGARLEEGEGGRGADGSEACCKLKTAAVDRVRTF